ncbi:MAG: alkane 1-monooxygenase, partial [Ferruginibacter sp.]
GKGFYCWIPLLYSFFLIPMNELFIKPDATNLDETEENMAKSNKTYDVLLWLVFPLQYFLLYTFLTNINQQNETSDIIGKIIGMGLLCGTFGINVAHELGHRKNKFEQFIAKALLLSSLYMHFFIEHNKGHHKHVATPGDPSTAKYKQSVYAFWIQTFTGTYINAWHIAINDSRKKKNKWPIVMNEMFLFQSIQATFLLLICWFFGVIILFYFIAAAIIGATLLETVNYIEHYGLNRKQTTTHSYERVMPNHSWNSNHVIGRLMLFELSRHSDHHYLASRKYQILRNIDEAPQMPTGYPGMIILALFPPLWFKIMHHQMKKLSLLPNH